VNIDRMLAGVQREQDAVQKRLIKGQGGLQT
jgi:hypothetical protein